MAARALGVTILGQLRLYLLVLGHQLLDLRLQHRNLAHLRPQGGVLGFQLGNTLIWPHAPVLYPQRRSVRSVPPLLGARSTLGGRQSRTRRGDSRMADQVRVFVSYHHSPEEDIFTARLADGPERE
jgi:hypothetical protein